jgi:hypothetical protein
MSSLILRLLCCAGVGSSPAPTSSEPAGGDRLQLTLFFWELQLFHIGQYLPCLQTLLPRPLAFLRHQAAPAQLRRKGVPSCMLSGSKQVCRDKEHLASRAGVDSEPASSPCQSGGASSCEDPPRTSIPRSSA